MLDQAYLQTLLRSIAKGKSLFVPIAKEAAEQYLGFTPEEPLTRAEAEKLRYHLDLLEERGLATIFRSGGASYCVDLTARGRSAAR